MGQLWDCFDLDEAWRIVNKGSGIFLSSRSDAIVNLEANIDFDEISLFHEVFPKSGTNWFRRYFKETFLRYFAVRNYLHRLLMPLIRNQANLERSVLLNNERFFRPRRLKDFGIQMDHGLWRFSIVLS